MMYLESLKKELIYESYMEEPRLLSGISLKIRMAQHNTGFFILAVIAMYFMFFVLVSSFVLCFTREPSSF